MPTQTLNLLPQATRTNFTQQSAAVQIPNNVLRAELLAICTNYTQANQTITLAAQEATAQAGPYHTVGSFGNNGADLMDDGSSPNKCSFSYSVDPAEWGRWCRSSIVTTGTITFRVDLILTT